MKNQKLIIVTVENNKKCHIKENKKVEFQGTYKTEANQPIKTKVYFTGKGWLRLVKCNEFEIDVQYNEVA